MPYGYDGIWREEKDPEYVGVAEIGNNLHVVR
jgi:hypothetical protein